MMMRLVGKSQNIPNWFIWNCTFKNALPEGVWEEMPVIGVINHSTPYIIPKLLQWKFLESPGEDKFVMQLGALHIKDRCQLMIPSQTNILSYGCTQSAPNDNNMMKITRYAVGPRI